MKILWLCNMIPPVVAEQFNMETSVKEGWISGSLCRLVKEGNSDIELGIVMPDRHQESSMVKKECEVSGVKIKCYFVKEDTAHPWIYDETLEASMKAVIEDYKPDLVHSFGTEYPHTLAMAKALSNPDKLMLGIQGVMSVYADDYFAELPQKIIKSSTFRDIVKRDNIAMQQEKISKRAEFERQSLMLAGHVTGRTAFDKEETAKINPKLQYHFMNETLRGEFDGYGWNIDNLDKHIICVSQGDNALKGFHKLLMAMPMILQKYPDTTIVVAGNSVTKYKTLKEKIKIGSYGKYLRDLMTKMQLENRVKVLGRLNASQMKDMYLSSSVYVSPSFCENSPNSMGEAMVLGTPVITARVGGIPSMAKEDEEVLMYDAPKESELANQIIKLFGDRDLALSLSKNASKRAMVTHNPDTNFARLLEIYKTICQ